MAITRLNTEKSDLLKGEEGLVYENITANQYAKEQLAGVLVNAFYFEENDPRLTEKEADKIREQMEKRVNGIMKYLGLDK